MRLGFLPGASRALRAGLAAAVCAGASLAGCTTLRADPAVAAEAVAAATHIDVDGARLYAEVHGARADAPLMVWLHGGPGGAQRPLFRYFNGDLQRHLLVAYYDQRGAGRSFDPCANAASLSIGRHVADLDAVVDHLRARFHRDRVLLVGHSWGATLGMLYAAARPSKVVGVVAVAPAVSFSEQLRREYAYALAEATRRADRRSLRELREIGPPPYPTPALAARLQQVAERYGAVAYRTQNHAAIVAAALVRGLVTPWEIVQIHRGIHRSLQAMHDELLAFDLRGEVARVDVPAFFFLGRHDRHADAALAAEYFEALRAPEKRLLWFERSAHDIPFDEPERFAEVLVREVLPLAVRGQR